MNKPKEKKKNNITIFATYWNEKFWVKPSLEQIKKLNSKEVIICDGCFDPEVPNYSTDSTREIIEKFVSENENVLMVSALRPGYIKSLWLLLRGHKHLPWWTIFRPTRWKFLIKSAFMSSYRRNQAITFNQMISLSKEWEEGGWFMNYDADQFYSDRMLKKIKKIINDESNNYGLITGRELTFFGGFNQFTEKYEERVYNNMPHRIYGDTIIQPTRGIMREAESRTFFGSLRKVWSRHLYLHNVSNVDAGFYYHYKFNDPERFKAGYKLGDREEPESKRKETKKFTGNHPEIIEEYFNL
jgi:hypothetical protein